MTRKKIFYFISKFKLMRLLLTFFISSFSLLLIKSTYLTFHFKSDNNNNLKFERKKKWYPRFSLSLLTFLLFQLYHDSQYNQGRKSWYSIGEKKKENLYVFIHSLIVFVSFYTPPHQYSHY